MSQHHVRCHIAWDDDKAERSKSKALKDKISIKDKQGEMKSQKIFWSKGGKEGGKSAGVWGKRSQFMFLVLCWHSGWLVSTISVKSGFNSPEVTGSSN